MSVALEKAERSVSQHCEMKMELHAVVDVMMPTRMTTVGWNSSFRGAACDAEDQNVNLKNVGRGLDSKASLPDHQDGMLKHSSYQSHHH